MKKQFNRMKQLANQTVGRLVCYILIILNVSTLIRVKMHTKVGSVTVRASRTEVHSERKVINYRSCILFSIDLTL